MRKFLSFIFIIFWCLSTYSQNIECVGNTIHIPLSGYKFGKIHWQFSSDKENWTDIPGQTSTNFQTTISASGYFRAKITYGQCDYFSDTTYIQAYQTPTIAIAGQDILITNGKNDTILNGNVPDIGVGYWRIISGNGTLSDSTKADARFYAKGPSLYKLSWNIVTPCFTSRDTVFISMIAKYGPVLKDIDNNQYKTALIGSQLWMIENLKALHYSNGNPIENVFAYNDNEDNVNRYGRLYKWSSATNNSVLVNVQGACPIDWHIPSEDDWKELINYLGGVSVAGGKMKEMGFLHWIDPNTGATNESLFSALGGGIKELNGSCYYMGKTDLFWSSNSVNEYEAKGVELSYDSQSIIVRTTLGKNAGLPIRCIKNR
jgi:uncharacterized protein (TIGR02145 family)